MLKKKKLKVIPYIISAGKYLVKGKRNKLYPETARDILSDQQIIDCKYSLF